MNACCSYLNFCMPSDMVPNLSCPRICHNDLQCLWILAEYSYSRKGSFLLCWTGEINVQPLTHDIMHFAFLYTCSYNEILFVLYNSWIYFLITNSNTSYPPCNKNFYTRNIIKPRWLVTEETSMPRGSNKRLKIRAIGFSTQSVLHWKFHQDASFRARLWALTNQEWHIRRLGTIIFRRIAIIAECL